MRSLIAATLFLFCACAYSSADLKSTKTTYDVFARYKYIGKQTDEIRLSHKRFDIKTQLSKGFLISTHFSNTHSEGLVNGDLQPLSYSSEQKALRQNWQFMPGQGRIQGYMNDTFLKFSQHKWPVFDSSSYLLALRRDLMTTGFKEKTYRVFKDGRLYKYNIKLIGKSKKIQTRMGPLLTDEVQVIEIPGGNTSLLWFAPSMNEVLAQSSYIQRGLFTSIHSFRIL